ncbi:MAG: NAD(+) synthase [Actinomycetaceae bacterium]|nr:NAD(+) synthase [Actinomycetaceae bacterium]
MNFYSLYDQGFARVAAVTLPVALANPKENAQRIIAAAKQADAEGCALAVFPELSITGYTAEDLFLSDMLYDEAQKALEEIRLASKELTPLLIVGAPLRQGANLYNTAVVIHKGQYLCVKPKLHIPNYGEFYEVRWFAQIDAWQVPDSFQIAEHTVPAYARPALQATDLKAFVVAVEICEELWVTSPVSADAAAAGATIIANLSASPVTVGRARDRRLMCQSASHRGACAYIYTSSGAGESTNDLAWDGQALIYEAGDLLQENQRYSQETQLTIADIDLDRLRHQQQRMNTFNNVSAEHTQLIEFTSHPSKEDLGLRRKIQRFPYVPQDPATMDEDCFEAYNIQVTSLIRRLQSIGPNVKPVLGVSGGLDSTQALLVCAEAMDRLGRPREDILTFTMPGFATSDHTRSNAQKLAEALGTTFATLDIRPTATQMLREMGHPAGRGEEVYDVTFENVQAGLRTDFLFRIANDRGGIVIGTGDLSELALGWCTYGVGDHMSHYSVNPGIPKTLMQHLVRWVVSSGKFAEPVNETLRSILATEITPELIPLREGEQPQSTQSSIGPYALHDFTLYYSLKYGYRVEKIAFRAWHAWRDISEGAWPANFPESERVAYDLPEILMWMRLFFRRFFQNQFKRTAVPNGVKVMPAGSLSPRGDWRMPSDASAVAWLQRIDDLGVSLGFDVVKR